MMGMHLGFIAVKASVSKFKEAFAQTWPQYEIVESCSTFPNADAVWAWKESHEEFVSAAEWSKDNRGKSVFLFWPDGDWAILLDPDYTHASDETNLQSLSQIFGTALSFVVESAGGTAEFYCAKGGSIVRNIAYCDGEVRFQGNALPEEQGIDVDNYYVDETERCGRHLACHLMKQCPQAKVVKPFASSIIRIMKNC